MYNVQFVHMLSLSPYTKTNIESDPTLLPPPSTQKSNIFFLTQPKKGQLSTSIRPEACTRTDVPLKRYVTVGF